MCHQWLKLPIFPPEQPVYAIILCAISCEWPEVMRRMLVNPPVGKATTVGAVILAFWMWHFRRFYLLWLKLSGVRHDAPKQSKLVRLTVERATSESLLLLVIFKESDVTILILEIPSKRAITACCCPSGEFLFLGEATGKVFDPEEKNINSLFLVTRKIDEVQYIARHFFSYSASMQSAYPSILIIF